MTTKTTKADQAGTRVPLPRAAPPAVRLRGARLAYGPRVLWDSLDLDIEPG